MIAEGVVSAIVNDDFELLIIIMKSINFINSTYGFLNWRKIAKETAQSYRVKDKKILYKSMQEKFNPPAMLGENSFILKYGSYFSQL